MREELFDPERLDRHARTLAAAQPVAAMSVPVRPLRHRLDDNAAALLRAYAAIAGDVQAGESVAPAAEWLLDNYHLVEAQIREVRSDLPPA